jgi:uncharacterized protein with PIN domain
MNRTPALRCPACKKALAALDRPPKLEPFFQGRAHGSRSCPYCGRTDQLSAFRNHQLTPSSRR